MSDFLNSTWRKERSFGPVAHLNMDGSLVKISCERCAFRVGGGCTHVRPSRQIPNIDDTPEWCEMREDILRDALKPAN